MAQTHTEKKKLENFRSQMKAAIYFHQKSAHYKISLEKYKIIIKKIFVNNDNTISIKLII